MCQSHRASVGAFAIVGNRRCKAQRTPATAPPLRPNEQHAHLWDFSVFGGSRGAFPHRASAGNLSLNFSSPTSISTICVLGIISPVVNPCLCPIDRARSATRLVASDRGAANRVSLPAQGILRLNDFNVVGYAVREAVARCPLLLWESALPKLATFTWLGARDSEGSVPFTSSAIWSQVRCACCRSF